MSAIEQAAQPAKAGRIGVWPVPVTALCCAIAIAITVAIHAGVDVSALYEGPEIGQGQLWRLVTSAFVHIQFLHILFNLYWMWDFGLLIETRFGSLRTALLILLLALASGAYDYGLDAGGIGLSGVVYGLFGTLWVLSLHDPRFAGTLPQSTLRTFVLWFFACIALTYFGVFDVANTAHGAGCVFGVLVGLAITMPRRRTAIAGATAVLLAVGVWMATLGREDVNLSGTLGIDEAALGYEALTAHHDAAALHWLLAATRLRPGDAGTWDNLSIAYARLGTPQSAQAAEAAEARADAIRAAAAAVN